MDFTLNPAPPTSQLPCSKARPKPQLSCNICKLRKVKCDRKQPCDTCTSHGYASSCAYPDKGTAQKQPTQQRIRRNPVNALSKLNHLENLVHSLMSERHQSPASRQPTQRTTGQLERDLHSEAVDALPNNFGRLSLDQPEASYVGSDHWAAVIDGIAELKNHLEDAYPPHSPGDISRSLCREDGPEIFHTHIRPASREEIVASLPPKDVVDCLVSTFFLQREHIPIFLHTPTFLKEYARFWADPNRVPVMWIGLLYSIMCLAARFQGTYEDARSYGSPGESQVPHSAFRIQEFKERTVQCLLAGHYTKPGRYTIETLLLYFMTEHLHHIDGHFGNWVLMGQVIRIAMRLGLHRDPSHTSKVSVFDGEIRRRMWTAIVQIDLTTSCQMGLPNMIRESYCDTREPLNLLDEDLDEDMAELPEPRPDFVVTPTLYLCIRNRILSVFAKVSDITTSVKPSTYGEVCELDNELLVARAAIPPELQIRPITSSATESADILMHQIYLDHVFQHARCMLHRKYLVPARRNDLYALSRATCIESALALLRHQQTLYHETRPGGQFEMRRWKLSSFLNYGLLLGATVLCVDLNRDLEEGLNDEEHWKKKDRAEIIEALHGAQQILLQSWDVSPDSRKGATAIGIILGKTGLSIYSNPDDTLIHGQERHFLAAQTTSWSLEEFFGSGFPQYQRWNESPPYSGGVNAEFS